MRVCRAILALSVLAALAAAQANAGARRQEPYVARTSIGNAGAQAAVPGDPVIEEPLRPLFPHGAVGDGTAVARCGPISSLFLPLLLFALQGLRLRLTRSG